MSGSAIEQKPVVQPRLLRLSRSRRWAAVRLWLFFTVLTTIAFRIAQEASEVVPDRQAPAVPWWVFLVVGGIGLTISTLHTCRWRLRIDDTGIALRNWRQWKLWPWEAFATGQVRKVEHRLDSFCWRGSPWRSFRQLSLRMLEDCDADWLREVIEQHLVPAPLPPPPNDCEFSYWPPCQRVKVRLDVNGLTLQTRRRCETFSWYEVQAVRILRLEHDRPEFRNLLVELPRRKIFLGIGNKQHLATTNWRGAKHFEIVGVLTRYVPANRIHVVADYGPPRDAAEAQTRVDVLRVAAKKLCRLKTARLIWAAAMVLVGCPLLVRYGIAQPDAKSFFMTAQAVGASLIYLMLIGAGIRDRLIPELRRKSISLGSQLPDLGAPSLDRIVNGPAPMWAPYRVCIGVGAVTLLVVVAWWVSPVDLVVPPRHYPPNNAYPALAELANRTVADLKSDGRLRDIESQLVHRGSHSLDPNERAYVLARLQPARAEYLQHLNDPCLVILDAGDWNVPGEVRGFRWWALGEAVRMDDYFRNADPAGALESYETVLRLSEQIRHGGTIITHRTGDRMQSAIIQALAQDFKRLDAEACDRLLQLTRDWQRYRVPRWEAAEQEKWQAIAICRETYRGTPPGFPLRQLTTRLHFFKLFNLRWSAIEASAYCDQLAQQWRQPVLQRHPVPEPKGFLSRMLLPFDHTTLRPLTETRVRLAACSAAVRAFHLRHARYPQSLDEAGVSDLNLDPYTGGGFVYHVSDRGFLLYSIGANGRDDGGCRPLKDTDDRGDVTLYRVQPAGSNLDPAVSLAPPIWTE